MSPRDKILKIIRQRQEVGSHELVEALETGRQTVAKHLKALVDQGLLEKTGSTRLARYKIAGAKRKSVNRQSLVRNIKGLQEDLVYEEVDRKLNLATHLSKNVQSIAFYAFGEMLNNAIDHSRAKTVEIDATIEKGIFYFAIRDRGIGAFQNIRSRFKLGDLWQAAEHLLKGKQTTMPSRHSGQGIFFTSKVADRFELYSDQLALIFNNEIDDVILRESPKIKGTLVRFAIRARSKKQLGDLFRKFANDDFEFDRNTVRMGLGKWREISSRSQARRLVFGLEKFTKIVLDFKGVDGIGQAFADEVFRVYQRRRPDLVIEPINMNQAVYFMIQRARKP